MPHDELITLPDGSRAFVRLSGRRPSRQPCALCQSPGATLQCDYPVAPRRTCDRHLCRGCAIPKGPNRDYCRTHETPGDLFDPPEAA